MGPKYTQPRVSNIPDSTYSLVVEKKGWGGVKEWEHGEWTGKNWVLAGG